MFELYIIFLENVNMVNISIQTIRADEQQVHWTLKCFDSVTKYKYFQSVHTKNLDT